MTALGLDLGTKTLGVAISRTGIIANPYKLLKYNNEEYDKLALEVADIVKKESIETIDHSDFNANKMALVELSDLDK